MKNIREPEGIQNSSTNFGPHNQPPHIELKEYVASWTGLPNHMSYGICSSAASIPFLHCRYRTPSLSYATGRFQTLAPLRIRSCCPSTSLRSSPNTCEHVHPPTIACSRAHSLWMPLTDVKILLQQKLDMYNSYSIRWTMLLWPPALPG